MYFIKLPENFTLSTKALQLDPNILLPVQKKDSADAGNFNMEELTQEQILAGILAVLAYDKENKNLPYYRKLIMEMRPNIKKELQEAAILKTRNEDWDLAEEIWQSLHGLDPENKAVILNTALFFDQRAESYRRNSLYDDADAYDSYALSYYKDALDSDPEIPDAFFYAGYFYAKKRNYAEAKNCFENYIALTTGLTDEELGENGLDRKAEAETMIEKITNRNLEDEHFKAAYEYISTGQEEKGLDEIRQFLQRNPAVWNAWFMLGWGLRRIGRFADAKMAFEKARECEGGDENADTLNELAICQMETGDLDGAKESLIQALNMNPDSTKVISNLGYLFLKQGNEAEARKYFMTVLEIDPEDKIARMELENLSREI